MSGLQATAEDALCLAALDPVAAKTLCDSLLEPARRDRDWEVVCVAERALGVASMTLSDIDSAVAHLRAAVAAGRRAGAAQATGEARMSLASALVLRGMPGQASRTIAAAVRDLHGVPAARAHVQRAAIMQELGRFDVALAELRRALPVLRRAGDTEWEVRALSNRSLIHVARRAFRAAEDDLLAALALCDEHGLELPGGYAEQNLGCVAAQRGDIPTSLRRYGAASERYSRFGVVEPSLLLDRAGVLLSVRLLGEARESAEAAVAAYAQQRRDLHLPEAQLMLSTVALLQGDGATALASATQAARGFRRLGHLHSLALARYAESQANLSVDPAAVTHGRMARIADELEASGWKVPALEARVLAARIALDHGRTASARRHLARASAARFVGPAEARARAWMAEALRRCADGHRPAALSALRAGLRIVEDHQAALGATELRAHVSVHRGAIARSGLRMALEAGDARAALWWAERGRTLSLLMRPAEPSADPELAHDLADLRSTMAEIEEARSAPPFDDRTLVRRQVTLERRIRDRCRILQGPDGADHTRASVTDLVGSATGVALVEFVELEDARFAITVARGRVRLHRVDGHEDLAAQLGRVPFALHRLAGPAAASPLRAEHAMHALRRAAARLDDLLLGPLRADVGDLPLVVVPSTTLESLPWSLLPSCVGRPVVVSPSAALWRRARGRSAPTDGAPTVVLAGPGLPGGAEEAAEIAALYPGSTRLRGSDATAAALRAHLDGAGLLHLAAHGRLRSDNPLFSHVVLGDGPMTVYEFERVARPPHHVVLASCDTGRQVVAGQETLGFGAAMLGRGTATLVAPVVPILDSATVPVMRAYHRGLVAGRTPAEALASAQVEVATDEPAVRATAASFVCLGAG